ncbi:MAG: CDP-alcohol phosphatidyltransferase family protein [Syntrophorhabdales bacterium]
MISSKIGHSLDPLLLRIYSLLFGNRVVSPNVLTVFGLFFSLIASVLAASKWPLFLAGILLLVSGFCDLLDGAVARSAKMATPFGGFLDSVLDRYSDLLVMLGISIHFLRQDNPDPLFSMISFFAAIGAAIIPYARARAEAASIGCRNGLLERSERIILLAVGLCFNLLRPVVVILAVFTHLTVVQRVLITKRAAEGGGS